MRKLTPELLDHLPHNDPKAIRSRSDLRRINRFMGNDSWIEGSVGKSPESITEIGAGDGFLLSKLTRTYPSAKISAYDLAPRPDHLPEGVAWHRGDILTQDPPPTGGVLIANLFLHHFSDDQLVAFAPWFHGFKTIIINEPLRARLPLIFGRFAHPFINSVTRHDMRVSIEAGFVRGELPSLLGLSAKGFNVNEMEDWRGAVRLTASK